MKRGFGSVMGLVLAGVYAALPLAVWAGAVEEVEGLPRYYEFFMKQGGQVMIEAERERDAQIASGAIAPIHVGKSVPDFRLPDGFDGEVGLRDYIGRKNVVLSTFRTWW